MKNLELIDIFLLFLVVIEEDAEAETFDPKCSAQLKVSPWYGKSPVYLIAKLFPLVLIAIPPSNSCFSDLYKYSVCCGYKI